jgi:hypothetical protein
LKDRQSSAQKSGSAYHVLAVQAARDAGISSDQLKTALRVHNVPRDEFECHVESDNPPKLLL